MKIAGAPISWGVCEVPGWGFQMNPDRVLSEMVELGLTATEFGPQGWLPVEPEARAAAVKAHGLTPVGAFFLAVMHDPDHDPIPAVKAELGRTAKPVRRESMQSKAPAPQQERLAKKDVRPAAPAQKDGESAASAGRAEIPAPEKQVLRARTKAPGIVIVRQAPAKTRSESTGASNAGSSRPARSSSAGGNAGGHHLGQA